MANNLRDAILADLEKSKPAKSSKDVKAKNKKQNDSYKNDISLEALSITKSLDNLFFCEKNMEEELAFVEQMFTRGAGSEERIGLHASAMIVSDNDFCHRQQVLSLIYRQNQGENISAGLKRIFEQGNAIHEKWQRLFIRGGLGKAGDMDRTQMCDNYELSYTPDAIIVLNGLKYIVEIKSMNMFSFQKALSHPSGSKQCQLYMHFTGIPRGFVLAEDKNTQEFKVFLEKYNPDVVYPFLGRLEDVKEMKEAYLEYGELPKRKCKNCNTKKALACNMRDACFNIGMGRVRFKK